MADKFKEAEALIQNLDGTPRGKLRIACTVAFGKSQLIPALPKFMEAYKEIDVSLDLTDRAIDIQAEAFDAAICFDAKDRNPDAIARRVMRSHRVLCAAPAYLQRHKTPKNFAELADHNCLNITGNSSRNIWDSRGSFSDRPVETKGNFEGNSTDVVFHAALAGMGIARLPSYIANCKFRSGELIHILPAYSPPSTDITVLFAETRNLAPKIRVFVDFLVDHFGRLRNVQ